MNVIFVVVDTLRADHLGCYGYERPTSPHLDAFAATAVVCEKHLATAIPTGPSFATINTGQYSIRHGVVSHGSGREIPRDAPWMPEIFLRHGLTTCAVDNLAGWRAGYERGYEFYVDPTRRRTLSINADSRELNRRVIPWLEQHHEEDFFLFVHYWDPHTPYMPPRAYRRFFYQGDPNDPKHTSLAGMEEHPLGRTWRDTWFNRLGPHITDANYIEALYDGEIRYCDESIGKLIKTVDDLGHRDDTMVVVTGDHGELMYRHGIFFDHHGLYDGNLHVPFIVRHPELKPGRVERMTEHVDVAPTLLDLAGVEVPEAMDGVSLVPWLRKEQDGPVRPFTVSQECTWQMKWCLRTETHKFILAREEDFYGTPMRELYDLREDPGEFNNIIDQAPGLARALEQQLEDWIAGKMAACGLTEDPLVSAGLSLGKSWKERRAHPDLPG